MINNFNINKNSTQYGRSLLLKCVGYTQYFLSNVYTNSTRTKKAQVETAQSGRSMIEMLGVLAIVGVLSVGGIAGYSKAMTKFKINKTIDQVSHLVTNIRTLYAQQKSLDIYESTAIDLGILPDSLTTTSRYDITNAFGGKVIIRTDYSSSTPGNYDDYSAYVVSFHGLPKEACVALATTDWGSKNSTGLTAIGIGGGDTSGPRGVYPGNCKEDVYHSFHAIACPGDSNKPTPMSVATAASACSTCEANKDCSIAWRFEK